MKFSICIPQYNRIEYLLKSLEEIKFQNYKNFEVIISDDCSKDDTNERILEFSKNCNFAIKYFQFKENQGYDRNLRKSMELASGEYCFVLGNDDTLAHANVLLELNEFLVNHSYPDVGYCNYSEFSNPSNITRRAIGSSVLGKGPEIGLKHYSCFSFVAGLIFKKSIFDIYNTSKFDKSIYAQIALALHMVCNGAILFSIDKIWVKKDIVIGQCMKSNSYRDVINRSWSKIIIVDGGLKSVIKVLTSVLDDNEMLNKRRLNYIFSKVLLSTYPFWVFDYKQNGATPAALGLYLGLLPWRIDEYNRLSSFQKVKIIFCYQCASVLAFVIPSVFFFKIKESFYTWVKKVF
jgi:glycosyltransferase involved in cell wall biosynthesis